MEEGTRVKLQGDDVVVSFKIDSDLSKQEKEEIICQIMDEINDRMMYVTEIKLNDEVFYKNPFMK